MYRYSADKPPIEVLQKSSLILQFELLLVLQDGDLEHALKTQPTESQDGTASFIELQRLPRPGYARLGRSMHGSLNNIYRSDI